MADTSENRLGQMVQLSLQTEYPWRSADVAAFRAAVEQVVSKQRRLSSNEDIRHIQILDIFGRLLGLSACAVAAWSLNPVSPVLIAIAQMGRWGLAHQILHHSYDNVPGCPKSLHGSHFGRGWRRLWDWCDWIIPEAWQMEHNIHHTDTGGTTDPDVVESNLEFIRTASLPKWRKAALVLLIIFTWRLTYYAPSTFIQLRRKQRGLGPTTYKITNVWMFGGLFNPFSEEGRHFWIRCVLPYATAHFVALPLLFVPFGLHAALNVLLTLFASEILFNGYSWALIASTHTADDIYRFDHFPKDRDEWYLHQLLGTANYPRGRTLVNWAQAWINFQIEHHFGTGLTLLQLERVRPEIEELCAKHGMPYITQSMLKRFHKMFAIAVGETSMRWSEKCVDSVNN